MQHALAFCQQVDLHLAPVDEAGPPLDEAVFLAAGDERNDAVRLGLQPHGELADGRELAAREALHVQQQQVLQRRDAKGVHGVFGEAFETSKLEAEIGQRLEFGLGERLRRGSSSSAKVMDATYKVLALYHVVT